MAEQEIAPKNKDRMDLSISVAGFKIPLSVIIIVGALITFIPNVLPLFDPGPPINSDIGVHYSAAHCLAKEGWWSIPQAWCVHGQAGLARYSRYAVVYAFMARLLSLVMSFELAFKLMMVIGFLILPISACAVLWRMGYHLAGSLALAFLLLEPGGFLWGGYTLYFVITGFINGMATGFSILCVFSMIWMLERLTIKRVIISSALTAVYFLSHQSSALWLPIAIIPMVFLYYKEIESGWKQLALFPVFFLVFVSFWLLPALAASSYFNPPGLGGAAIGSKDLVKSLFNLDGMQQSLITLGLIGSILLVYRKERRLKFIGVVALMIPLVWAFAYKSPEFFYFNFFTIDRSMYEFRTFVVLCASLFLGGLVAEAFPDKNKLILAAGVIVSLVFLITFQSVEASRSHEILTGQDIEKGFAPVYKFVEKAHGRVIAENTYYSAEPPFGSTQPWALASAYSDKEFLGNSDFWYTKDDYSVVRLGVLFGNDTWNMTDDQMDDVLDGLNVQYIWAYTPSQGDFAGRLAQAYPLVTQIEVPGLGRQGLIFETPFNHTYLSFKPGNMSDYSYDPLRSSAKVESAQGGTLLFKVRHWPNWGARIDGKEVPVSKGKYGLMEIDVPAGAHYVEFSYGYTNVDLIGYAISLIGIIMAAIIITREYYQRHRYAVADL